MGFQFLELAPSLAALDDDLILRKQGFLESYPQVRYPGTESFIASQRIPRNHEVVHLYHVGLTVRIVMQILDPTYMVRVREIVP